MNKPKASGSYPAKQQKDNDTRRPDILYNCKYPGKPGTSICTNGKQYKYQYVTTRVGNTTKRELLPVYDPTALFNINAPKRAAEREKRRLSQAIFFHILTLIGRQLGYLFLLSVLLAGEGRETLLFEKYSPAPPHGVSVDPGLLPC